MTNDKIEKVSSDFHERTKNNSDRLVSWMMTWKLGLITEDHLMVLIEKAFPHMVLCNEKYYGNNRNYNKMNKWIEKNSKGYWTHINIHFYFELEEDAMAFKLRWV